MQLAKGNSSFSPAIHLNSRSIGSAGSLPCRKITARNHICRASLWPFTAGRNGLQTAQDEFLKEITNGTPDKKRLSGLVDKLVSEPVKFNESSIGGGPWQVVYTRGPLLWQNLTGNGELKSAKQGGNVAYQDFEPSTRGLVNYGQLIGESVYAVAEGKYEPLGDSSNTPVEIEATVEKGALHLFGLRIPLPIKGSGKVNLVYIDNKSKIMRIFNSQGSISVQVRKDWLQRQLQ